jgi:UDP-N-acetylglucosamine/UDP-N-acetylgalactosamine diphosphorylase
VLAAPAADAAGSLAALDPGALSAAFRRAIALRERQPRPLAPAPVLALEARAERAEARAAGEALLAEGAVAALVVAGGQATRLGRPGPKGLFPIGPVSDRTLFALHAQKLRRVERRFGRRVPWVVMTSEDTEAATRAYFEREGNFGLEVHFIRQRQVPCVDREGRPLLREPGVPVTAPDGHGGVLWALARSGTLERLGAAGIRALAYHQVDNPLARWVDPLLLGLLQREDVEVACKVAAKRRPDEGLGNAVTVDGRVQVVEYTEIDAAQATARDEAGRLRIWAGAIGLHAFRLDFLARLAPRADALLPFHASPKRIPCLGAVAPREPNGYKLERFVFDLLPEARALVMVEAQRDDEYAPVKTAEGEHSPASARRALDACARRWLSAAGARLPGPELCVELDHAVIDGPEDAAFHIARDATLAGPAIRIGPGVSV